MSNLDIAYKFAQGATKGKGSNVFIEGDTIYSYGYHFPMATRTAAGFLVTYRKYSSSTARHLSYVRRAIPDVALEVYKPTEGVQLEDIEYHKEQAAIATAKQLKARSEWSIANWQREANHHTNQVALCKKALKAKQN